MADIKQNTSYGATPTSPSANLGEGIGSAVKAFGKVNPQPSPQVTPTQSPQSPAPVTSAPTTGNPTTDSNGFFDPTSFSGDTTAQSYLKGLGPITNKAGAPGAFEKIHPAVDIGLKGETDLIGFDDGVVESVRTDKKSRDMSGYGNQIIIRKANGDRVLLNHLGQVYLKPGDVAQKGTKWGTMSNTGSVVSLGGGGFHLDLRLKDLHDRWLNPEIYYGLNM